MYFLGYKDVKDNRQWWGTEEKLKAVRKDCNERAKARFAKLTPASQIKDRKWKMRDVCPDTKRIFWGYTAGGYELWVDSEKFEERIKKQKERSKKYSSKKSAKEKKKNYYNNKYKENKLFALRANLGSRMGKFFRKMGIEKQSKTVDLIGAEWETVKIYLESQFTEGMSWENRGEWHVDHKIPLSKAKSEDEMYKLFHYTNLQPLWGPDNLSKGSKTQEEWEELKKLKELHKSVNE